VLYVESLSDVTMMRHMAILHNLPSAQEALRAIPRIKPIMGHDGKTQIGQIIEYNPVPQADGDGCTCLKGGPGCDTWEEYPGQPWGEFAKNSECPIHGEDR